MMKKKYIIASFLISSLFIAIPKVNAVSFNVGYADTGEETTNKPREDITVNFVDANDDDIKYTCTYNYEYNVNKKITIDGYDMYDNEIMKHSLNISDDNRILAGTSIGLRIFESKTVSWELTKIEVKKSETKYYKRYECTYSTPTTDLESPYAPQRISNKLVAFKCETATRKITSDEECPTLFGCELKEKKRIEDGSYMKTSAVSEGDYYEECRKTAVAEAIRKANNNVEASYKIELKDSNDINKTDKIYISNENANNTKKCFDENGNKTSECAFKDDGTTKGTKSFEFYYQKARACINVKTGIVTYKDKDSENCDEKIEKEISNTNGHWHYFVPLNAKSTDSIEIDLLKGSDGKLKSEECKYVMQNNPINVNDTSGENTTYVNLIIPIEEGKNFRGDYYCSVCNPNGNNDWNEKQSSDYAEIMEKGCYLTSKIKLPIKQKFYSEKTVVDESKNETVKLNGFNFYYKPIDVSDSKAPFPNGLSQNTVSLWKKWYQSDKKTPDLTKSYSKITYIAEDINVKTIRDYNSKSFYTDWNTMNIDGTSQFIDTLAIIKRNQTEDTENKTYPLGCGPANENALNEDNTTNILYQAGCAR